MLIHAGVSESGRRFSVPLPGKILFRIAGQRPFFMEMIPAHLFFKTCTTDGIETGQSLGESAVAGNCLIDGHLSGSDPVNRLP